MRKTTIVEQKPVTSRHTPPNLNIAIRSDVILGSPSARCNGVGICRVMGIGENPECPCPRTEATLSVTPKGGIQFQFTKNRLSSQMQETHFQWGIFSVIEPYRLSARLCKQLGWGFGWIQPGVYQVWETATTLTVVFDQHNHTVNA